VCPKRKYGIWKGGKLTVERHCIEKVKFLNQLVGMAAMSKLLYSTVLYNVFFFYVCFYLVSDVGVPVVF
jgi:hypothetical protein